MTLVPLRGVLVEYGSQFLGPIPNIVIFQFNPDQMTRTIVIPGRRARPNDAGKLPQRESHTTSAPPVETFSITAKFSAADDLGTGGPEAAIPLIFGVGPQLAALEKMVYPPKTPGGAIGAAIDAIGAALSEAGEKGATRPTPRERLPRILFLWGTSRVLPVSITSMAITEQKYDRLLNPVQAEVQIGLEVASRPPDEDEIARGALNYSQMIKDTQASLNLTKAVEFVREFTIDIVPF